MSHQPKAQRGLTTLIVALAALAWGASAASASSLTYTTVGNLQGLLNAGDQGITVDDVVFYDFAYTSIGTPANPAPNAGQIYVATITGPTVGLRFNAPWFSAAGFDQLSTISYSVRDLDGAIASAKLSFNGAVLVAGQQTGTSVVETVDDANSSSILGTLTVSNAQLRPTASSLQSTLPLSTPTSPIRVTESINVQSGTDAGMADISFVDNTFRTIPTPLPASCWGGMGLIACLALRRAIHARQSANSFVGTDAPAVPC